MMIHAAERSELPASSTVTSAIGDPHVSGRIHPVTFISDDPQAVQGHHSLSGNRGDTEAYRKGGFCVRGSEGNPDLGPGRP